MARRRKTRRTAKQKAATRKMIAANRRLLRISAGDAARRKAVRLKGIYPNPKGRRDYVVLSSRKGKWMGKDFEKVNGKVERML
jgi:hypothetical protein